MIKISATVFASCVLCLATGFVSAEENPIPNCPVMGKPIDFSVSAATKDGPAFLCCKRCAGRFEGNPAKYDAKVKDQRKALAKFDRVQVTCPISGNPIDPTAFAEIKGQKIYACCKDCVGKIESDFDNIQGKMAASYTYQTKCPVMGETINPKVSTTLESGEKVYFCCKRCIGGFKADPARYAPNLKAQNYGALSRKIAAAAKK